jgi:hypothetical protein
MKLTANQQKILQLLLDKYEGSKTYQGINQRNQNFAVTPSEIWKNYTSDFSDVSQVQDFERELQELKEQGLISLETGHGEVKKILAVRERMEEYYSLLCRKKKSAMLQEQQEFYEKWLGQKIPIVTEIAKEQLELLKNGKKSAYESMEAEKIFRILQFIQSNSEELLERELSILLLADSKMFDRYRNKVCKLLRKYLDVEELLLGVDDDRECNQILLEEFHIYKNPSYVYLKGMAELSFADGTTIPITDAPIAFSSLLLKKLSSIRIQPHRIMTVENLTTFHRMNETDCFYIFLSGYHNTAKQLLIRRIYQENPGKIWQHFGDLDPDGFYILEHLRRGTGIPFEPYAMDLETLQSFFSYGKPLEKNDRIKAQNLIKQGKYAEVLSYMLDQDRKLEQEIVSLKNKGLMDVREQ